MSTTTILFYIVVVDIPVTFEMVFSSPVQCDITEEKELGMIIQNAISEHDSLGGLVVGYAFNTVMCATPEAPLPEPLPMDDQVIPDPTVDGARQRQLVSAGWTYSGGGACHGCHPDNRDGLSDEDITLRSSSLAMAAMEDELSLMVGKLLADKAPAVPCLEGVDAGLKVLLTSTASFDATQFGCATR